jgi:hypothetical protein
LAPIFDYYPSVEDFQTLLRETAAVEKETNTYCTTGDFQVFFNSMDPSSVVVLTLKRIIIVIEL